MVTESRSVTVYIDDKHDKPTTMNHHSSILGAAIGDISGSAHESFRNNTNRVNYKFFTQRSSLTDDTVLTMAVAEWLMHPDRLSIADALRKWGGTWSRAHYGRAFKHFMQTGASWGATSNGAAMRVGPVGQKASSLDEALALAAESAAPTHAGSGLEAAQAIAAAVFLAKSGISDHRDVAAAKADIRSYITERFGYDLDSSVEDIRARMRRTALLEAEKKSTGVAPAGYVSMTDGARSAEMAITAVLLADSFENAVRLAVSMGGDSDTIAAMAGSVAAQLWGIPEGLIRLALVYLPVEMIAVINDFDGSAWEPTGIEPPNISQWPEAGECVVYGSALDGQADEDGRFETVLSSYNHHPLQGYAIPTVGRSLDEIRSGVEAFIAHAQANPLTRFHVRKVGYHKAGYTVAQIAPLFREARSMSNVLLPEEIISCLDS